MLVIDPFAGYVICGVGSLVGGLMMAISRPDDQRLRRGLATCGVGFVVLGAGLIQFLLFSPVPRAALIWATTGVIVGTGLFGWGFARLRGQRVHPGWVFGGMPALVAVTVAGHQLPGASFALVFESAAGLIAAAVLWLNRSYALRPRHPAEALLALNLFFYLLAWVARLCFTLGSGQEQAHLLQAPEPWRTCFAVFYGVVPIIISALVLNIVNAELALRLRMRAITDELTGLLSRRGLLEQAPAIQERARKDAGSLALLLFDIDHFKRVNDTHGHAAGDEALRHAARVIDAHMRADGLLARHGGEEFIALVPVAHIDDAERVADRQRAALAVSLCRLPAGSLRLTVSVGVSLWEPGEALTQPIARADAAMYRAKSGGRNRVALAAA